MNSIRFRLGAVLAAVAFIAAAVPASASQFVRIQYNLGLNQPDGSFFNYVYLELFDDTPLTQANFLTYVNGDEYNNVVMHRLVSGFVLQGGGYTWNGSTFDHIATHGTVDNEFNRSNLRGTLAMAKLGEDAPGGGPDSATSEFFFNLADNSANLDGQNGGFTVFARVLGNGMDLIDAYATLPTFSLGQLTDVPLLTDTSGTPTDFLYMADVSQVELTIGDTDLNGQVNQDDADLLQTTLVSGTDQPQFDVDQNGTVNQADLDLLNALLLGDLNGDGYVGLDDLQPILDHWNQNVTLGDKLQGDVNGPDGVPDGYIGLDDLQGVLDAWNVGTPPPPAATVPEPATLAMFGLAAAATMFRRRA